MDLNFISNIESLFNGQYNIAYSRAHILENFKHYSKEMQEKGIQKIFDHEKSFIIYQYLDWDSRHFSTLMYRINYVFGPDIKKREIILRLFLNSNLFPEGTHFSIRCHESDIDLFILLKKLSFNFLTSKDIFFFKFSKVNIFKKIDYKVVELEKKNKSQVIDCISSSPPINRFLLDDLLDKDSSSKVYVELVASLIEKDTNKVFTINIDNKVAAFVIYSTGISLYRFKMKTTLDGFISMIVVNPEFRKKGLGSNLLNKSLINFKEITLKYVFANTDSSNTSSKNLFKRNGFIRSSGFSELSIRI